MIHPDTELQFINEDIGYGVVAKSFIPKGTVTWVLDKFDRTFDPKTVEKFDPVYRNIVDTYCYRNNLGQYVLCWDHPRFVNHSFRSNCLTTAYDFEIAVRDIAPGEQLTDDYGYLNIDVPFKPVDEGTRRKTVYPDDLLRYHRRWDLLLKNALERAPDLPQPLSEIIDPETWNKVVKISRNEEEMDSILMCFYKEDVAAISAKLK
ncbi:MAG: SET domain-containing protein [Cryomorphaceae bacterium]|nr:SET domain-containing protein [Flavobacteriales bacterium]